MATIAHKDSEAFNLAVAGGFYHPDREARSRLRRALDEWLEGLGATPCPEAVERLLCAEKGTPIEPFSLTREDVECAVFLARAAFSEALGQTRLRIVSRETIGRGGGLVLTRRLKSFYLERWLRGRNRARQKSGWTFVPSDVPASKSQVRRSQKAVIAADDEGFTIRIPLPERSTAPVRLATRLEVNSVLGKPGKRFSELGLRTEVRGKSIVVSTGSPESLIRFAACLAEQAVMRLDGGEWEPDIPPFLLRLAAPSDRPTSLPTLVGATPSYCSWLEAVPATHLRLGLKLQLAISTWLRPHPRWMDGVFKRLS